MSVRSLGFSFGFPCKAEKVCYTNSVMRSRGKRFYTKQPTINDFPVSLDTKTRKPRVAALVALILIILIGGIFLVMTLSSGQKGPSVTPTPTMTALPSDTPTPEASVSAAVTPSISITPTGTSSPSVDKTTGLDRSSLNVAIQNGSGTPGAASKIASTLKTLGYSVGSTGNAQTFNYTDITIQIKATKASYLPLLKKDLSASYTIGQTTKDLPASTQEDVLIIVGK